MEFDSILFDGPAGRAAAEVGRQPAFLADLLLDRVVAAVVAGREEYDLTPWLYAPIRQPATVSYRHEVFQDLNGTAVHRTIVDFADQMRAPGSWPPRSGPATRTSHRGRCWRRPWCTARR